MIQLELPLTAPNHSMINEKDEILQYRLLVIRSGVRLEAQGLRKSGKTYTAVAKQMLGFSRNTKREEVLQALDALINTFMIK